MYPIHVNNFCFYLCFTDMFVYVTYFTYVFCKCDDVMISRVRVK